MICGISSLYFFFLGYEKGVFLVLWAFLRRLSLNLWKVYILCLLKFYPCQNLMDPCFSPWFLTEYIEFWPIYPCHGSFITHTTKSKLPTLKLCPQWNFLRTLDFWLDYRLEMNSFQCIFCVDIKSVFLLYLTTTFTGESFELLVKMIRGGLSSKSKVNR